MHDMMGLRVNVANSLCTSYQKRDIAWLHIIGRMSLGKFNLLVKPKGFEFKIGIFD